MKRTLVLFLAVTLLALAASPVLAAEKKPNILVIWGDDVGQTNISAYTMGLVGYQTPNIDRIANEGIIFTDYYAEQSCTAGRSTFITGQTAFRTGLSKVGMPGAPQGMKEQDATIAALLKAQGYATGQFGKNHLGDLDEHLPTNHGFDEFFGNLYHLNAEEEPENEDYPADLVMADGRSFKEVFGPRGVIKSSAVYDKNGAVTSRRSKTPEHSPRSAWKSSTTIPWPRPSSSSGPRNRMAPRGSSGGTARACTSVSTSAKSALPWPTRPLANTSTSTPQA